jgi:caa(3)-type oxidase subunit IV
MSEQHHTNYVKIWAILLALLVVSVLGPELGIKWVTLVTAFGIAGVKAYIVATKFMHINDEKNIVTYILVTMMVLMVVFIGGTSSDIMNHEGTNWSNDAAKEIVEAGMAEIEAAEAHGDGGHH